MPHPTPARRERFPHHQVLSIVKDFAMGREIMEFHLGTLLVYYCRHHQQCRHSDSDSHRIHYSSVLLQMYNLIVILDHS